MDSGTTAQGAVNQAPAVGGWHETGFARTMLVIVSALGLGVATMHVYSFGMVIEPLEREFGWSRGQITAGLTIWSVVSVLFAPPMGFLADRMGSRRVAIVGVTLFCGALALLSFAGPGIASWWLGWTLVAFGSVCIKTTVWTKAVASRFTYRRGLALAFTLCGSGAASMILPPIVTQYIADHGWRAAYVAMGVGGAAVVLPLLLLFFHDARDLARNPGRGKAAKRDTAPVELPGLTIREGLRSPAFWRIALIAFLLTSVVTSMLVHFVPLMTLGGISRIEAAAAAGLIGAMSMVGRLVTGAILDMIDARIVGVVATAFPVVACLLLLNNDGSIFMAIAVAIAIGLALGSEVDVLAFVSAQYFGMRSYGTLFGAVAGLVSFGSGIGPTIAGFIFDHHGHYDPALYAATPLLLLSALLMATLPRLARPSLQD